MKVLVDSSAMDNLCARIKALEESIATELYEYRDVWAEETGTLAGGNSEWSFGEGSNGAIGIPVGEGWEVIEMGFNADQYSQNATVRVDVVDYSTSTAAADAPSLGTIELANASDGGGVTNNAFKILESDPSFKTTTSDVSVIGFRTVAKTGTVTDARVSVRLRRLLP